MKKRSKKLLRLGARLWDRGAFGIKSFLLLFFKKEVLLLFFSLPAHASPEARLGRQIFFDVGLSASGRLACASCHSPAHAYGPPNGLAVQMGGAGLDQPGLRAVPSLRYALNRTPIWNKVYVANPAERVLEGEEPPTGGFGWDGRFNTLRDQAAFPLLARNEMANANAEAFAARLRRATYAGAFRRLYGAHVFDDPEKVFENARRAIERFELEDPALHPYSSKYDAYLDGRARLTAQEARGLALFDDPARAGCAICHPDRKGMDGSHPLFTDYQFEVLGVPRNPEIPANRAPDFHDLGLCGPLRADQMGEPKYCGMFKTPTLRNVAARGAFFHNGRFHTLAEALRFYVSRDTNPADWYKAGKFDDLPASLKKNADIVDPPLTRHPGEAPAWNDSEIADVVAFLRTLTDRDVAMP